MPPIPIEVVAGQMATFTLTFTTEGEPVDPASLLLAYHLDGQDTQYVYGGAGSPITRSSAGVYTAAIDTTELFGVSVWVAFSKGTGQAVSNEVWLDVEAPAVSPTWG